MSISINPLKDTKLFQKIKLGKHELAHRVANAPTTRIRALKNGVPSDLMLQYYDERSRAPGTLIVTEGTTVIEGGSFPGGPGIFSEEQVQAWKTIVDKVHANGSLISIQAFSPGRTGIPSVVPKGKNVAPSAIYISKESEAAAIAAENPLREITEEEIQHHIYEDYTRAAKNVLAAGFDFFEIHVANGYLLDQFVQPGSNQRTDKYGGSIENRARFVLELVDHLIEVLGADRLGLRLSPWATYQNMNPEGETHAITQYSYLVWELEKRARKGHRLAYLSLLEPRVSGASSLHPDDVIGDNSFLLNIWKGTVIRAGNYTYGVPELKQLINDVDDDRTIIAFSRFFTSNPDLVDRLREGKALTPYDRATFYTSTNLGYNTWGVSGEERVFDKEVEDKKVPTIAASAN